MMSMVPPLCIALWSRYEWQNVTSHYNEPPENENAPDFITHGLRNSGCGHTVRNHGSQIKFRALRVAVVAIGSPLRSNGGVDATGWVAKTAQ